MVEAALKAGAIPAHASVPRRFRLVVVGGGISGLAAAHRAIERAPLPELELVLLEASNRLGGVIASERRDGFLLEAGPDSFITEKPAGIELCRRLGLETDLLPTNDRFRRTLIVRDGRLVPLPDGFQLIAPTRLLPFLLSPALSLRGRLIAAKDLFLPRGGPGEDGDESLADFVRRRLGNEVLERLAQPLVGGIYTADAENLSLASTMPRFLALEREHRSLILGLRAQARRAGAADTTASGARFGLFVTLRDGMASLVSALEKRLPPGSIRTCTGVARLERLPRDREATTQPTAIPQAWQVVLDSGEVIAADGVVLAVGAPVAAKLVAGLDRELARDLASIAYASSAIVLLAYRRSQVPRALDAFGFVVPAVERRRLIAGSFSSVKYSGRAPDDAVLLRLFVGGALQPELFALGDEAIARLARDEMRDLLGIAAEPLLTSIHRWPQSMPQYRVGHSRLVRDVERRVASLIGLALAGNAYHGVGLADCIRSGEAAAEEVLQPLTSRNAAGVA